jgi:hypothetical protein
MTARVVRLSVLSAVAASVSLTVALYAQAPATPRQANGRPDLNGTWDTGYMSGVLGFVQPKQLEGGSVCLRGCDPAPAAARGGARAGAAPAPPPARDYPKYKPELLARVKDFEDRQVQLDTVLRCMAPGVPRIGPPQKIVQTSREVIFLYDDVSGAFFRIVPIDGRPHRKDLPPSYLGDAVGRWDGDTLVVETVNFNDDTWLTDDGAFHTTDLRVVERLRRVGNTIEYQATAHDPAVLAEPWAARPRMLQLTDREMEEPARCEDRSLANMKDGTHHDNPR